MKLNPIRPQTVKLISKLLHPIAFDTGVITVEEYREITMNLKYLSEHDALVPVERPKLLTQTEAAEYLNISLAHFKNLERDRQLPFSRKMLGTAIRYRSSDLLRFVLDDDASISY